MELMRALAQSQFLPDFPPYGYAIANSCHMGPPLFCTGGGRRGEGLKRRDGLRQNHNSLDIDAERTAKVESGI